MVFCGLYLATTAAAAGHNFSSRSNRFWTVLHLAGFTDVRLQPHEERRLLDYWMRSHCCRRPTNEADDWRVAGRIQEGAAGLRSQDLALCPPFDRLSRQARAFSAMIDQPDVEWGRHPTRCAGRTAWLLPNPGGLNKAFTLDALVTAYGDLRTALLAEPSPREC